MKSIKYGLCLVLMGGMFSLQEAFAFSNSVRIPVSNQEEFDAINMRINQAVQKGDRNIKVYLKPGVYKYHNNHITIDGIDNPDVRITIKGKKVTVVADGTGFSANESTKYVIGSGYINASCSDVQNYSKMYQLESLVEVVDFDKKICRVPCLEDINHLECIDLSCAKLELTMWYTSCSYDITKITDGFIYFYANNLAKGIGSYGDYNVNYDFTVGRRYPRYRVVNLPTGGCQVMSDKKMLKYLGAGTIHQCEVSRFLTVSNSKIKGFTMNGIRFVGCGQFNSLIHYNKIEAGTLAIVECEFSCMRGIVVDAQSSNNLKVESCVFHDNYTNVINVHNSSDNAIIRYNCFYANGKSATQTFCIICRGGNYTIAHNEIYDFNYGAIGVGIWYKDTGSIRPSYGIVEYNHIYHTEAYQQQKGMWTLIDSGAIYVWTRNDGAVIRYNYIHDYSGMGSNRGIYCDDGTNNCSIYDNIVLNIENSYGIDLRKSLTLDSNKTGKSNVNNKMFGNVFNNRFRFEGRGDDSTSIKGRNYIVTEGEELPRIVVNSVVETEEDEIVHYTARQVEHIAQTMLRRK